MYLMSLEQAVERIKNEECARSYLITDPHLEDNPIVFANDAFIELTGYSREETLGRNCRFLQGDDTDPKTIHAIHDAVDASESVTVDILNYRKNGTPFWNRLRIRPIFSGESIESFVGVQNSIEAWEVRKELLFGCHD